MTDEIRITDGNMMKNLIETIMALRLQVIQLEQMNSRYLKNKEYM